VATKMPTLWTRLFLLASVLNVPGLLGLNYRQSAFKVRARDETTYHVRFIVTKIVLLFAGFALAGPGAYAEFKVPKNLSHAIHYVLPEYKETFISFDLDKNLAKQISLVIESGTPA
jgi:hypothetical protein